MLIRFKSTKTESITMFGASGAIPSAIAAEELPAAARDSGRNSNFTWSRPELQASHHYGLSATLRGRPYLVSGLPRAGFAGGWRQ